MSKSTREEKYKINREPKILNDQIMEGLNIGLNIKAL